MLSSKIATINPIPALTTFFRSAKVDRGKPDVKLTTNEFKTLEFILKNFTYPGFSGFSLANLLQGIVYKKGSWKTLEDQNLSTCMKDVLLHHHHSFKAIDTACILMTLGQLRMSRDFYIKSGLDAIFITKIKESIDQFDHQNVSCLLQGLLALNFTWSDLKARELDTILLYAVRNNLKNLNKVSTANILWSLAHFGITWEELQKEKLAEPLLVALEKFCSDMDATLLTQVRQAQLWFDFVLVDTTQTLLQSTLKKLPKPKSSKFHKQIADRFLCLTDETFENEKCFGDVLWVDIAFGNKGFEIDGPVHDEKDYLDRFKELLLKKLNVSLKRISYKDDTSDKFLKKILEENGIKLKTFKPRVTHLPKQSLFAQHNRFKRFSLQDFAKLLQTTKKAPNIGKDEMLDETDEDQRAVEAEMDLSPTPSTANEKSPSTVNEKSSAKVSGQVVLPSTSTHESSMKKSKKQKHKKKPSMATEKKPIPVAAEPKKSFCHSHWHLFAVGTIVLTGAVHWLAPQLGITTPKL